MVAVHRNELGESRSQRGLRVIEPQSVSRRKLRRSQARVLRSLRSVLIVGAIITVTMVAFSIGDSVSSAHSFNRPSDLTGPTVSYLVGSGDSPVSIASKVAPNKVLVPVIANEITVSLAGHAIMPGSVIQIRI